MTDTRVPAGVPTGGQFAALGRNEAEVTLDAASAATDPCWGCGRGPHGPQDAYPDLHVYRPRSEVLAAMDRDDYADARAAVENDWHLETRNVEMLPPFEREARYAEVAAHFEATARRAASEIPAHEVPRPGESLLNRHTGVLYAAADYATQARLNAGHGPFRVEQIEAGGDALTQKILDTRDFTAANGIPFRARIVRRGQQWGRDGSLVAQDDLVMFFDARYPDMAPMIGNPDEDGERNGQHVSNYHARTLREHPGGAGIDLHGGEPSWKIDGRTFGEVLAWIERRTS
ncbi:hypothetical protein [Nocardioides pakistanensis]